MAGLFSRVAEPCGWLAATEKRKKKKTFFPFLYAHACSCPTVTCFKELTGANANLAPSFALFPAKKKKKTDQFFYIFFTAVGASTRQSGGLG